MSQIDPSAAPEARLTIDVIRWMVGNQLSAVAGGFLAFGAALLLQQSSDQVAEETIRAELGDRDGGALIEKMSREAAETTYAWVPVSLVGWLICLGLAVVLAGFLFFSTKGPQGWDENKWLYRLLGAGFTGAGTALVVAAVSNALLQLTGGAAPWLFIFAAVGCFVGSALLKRGFWSALWAYVQARRAAIQNATAGSTAATNNQPSGTP
jgi:hypothetical protein